MGGGASFSHPYACEPLTPEGMESDPEGQILHREFDTDVENPAVQVAETVAELEGKDSTDLSTMYECVDGVLEELFSKPPSPDAQMAVEFSYETYRVTIEQNGAARFVKTG